MRRWHGVIGIVLTLGILVCLAYRVVSHGAAMVLGLVCLWVEGFTLDELRGLRVRWRGASYEPAWNSLRWGWTRPTGRESQNSHGPVRDKRET